jgi:hypothetical protein
MGFLRKLFKPALARPPRLPAGSFTVDSEGRVMSSTLPHSFSATNLDEIAQEVLLYFQSAQLAHLPVRELIVHYPALRLSARELRGGAIVFLSPRAPGRR